MNRNYWSWHFRKKLLKFLLGVQNIPLPHWKLQFRQILALSVLTTTEHPPNWNICRSWNLEFEFWLLQNTPLPWKLKLQQFYALWVLTTTEHPPPYYCICILWRLIAVSPKDTFSFMMLSIILSICSKFRDRKELSKVSRPYIESWPTCDHNYQYPNFPTVLYLSMNTNQNICL